MKQQPPERIWILQSVADLLGMNNFILPEPLRRRAIEYARVHPVDDARVEEIAERNTKRRCLDLGQLYSDIDYLLSLLPQLSSSEMGQRCTCGHRCPTKYEREVEDAQCEHAPDCELMREVVAAPTESSERRCGEMPPLPDESSEYQQGWIDAVEAMRDAATTGAGEGERREVIEAARAWRFCDDKPVERFDFPEDQRLARAVDALNAAFPVVEAPCNHERETGKKVIGCFDCFPPSTATPGEAAAAIVDDLFCDGALVPAERLVLAAPGQLQNRTGWNRDAARRRITAIISRHFPPHY